MNPPSRLQRMAVIPSAAGLGLLLLFLAVHPLARSSPARAAFPGENGLIVFQTDGPDEIYVVEADGSGLTNLSNHPARDEIPAFSADGSKIVFGSDRGGGPTLLYTMDADGSNVTALTQPPMGSGSDSHPAWSPTGDQVAFISTRGGGTNLYVIDADGNNMTPLTTGDSAGYLSPSWSPDGNWIAFSGGPSLDGSDIYLIHPDGTGLTNLTNSPHRDEDPNWSPDGTRLVFASNRDNDVWSSDLWVMNADGSGVARLIDDPHTNLHPAWSPDGTRIVFASSRFQPPWGLVVWRDGCMGPVPGAPGGIYPDWQPQPGLTGTLTMTDSGPPYCLYAPILNRSGAITTTRQARPARLRFAPRGATIWYVDADAGGAGTGASWTDAFTDLQDALAAAVLGDEIWVAEGLYKPTPSASDRNAAFTLQNGIALYGGFDGTETQRDQREPSVYVTVLSGDIDGNDVTDPDGVVLQASDINGSNTCHVVISNFTDATASLDGFTITAGDADTDNCDFGPSGGGLLNDEGGPSLANLVFSGNRAFVGGGMITTLGNGALTNVVFTGNHAVDSGGGYFNGNSTLSLTDALFIDNSANAQGGGLYIFANTITVTNVILEGNTAGTGGGIHNQNGSGTLTNVLFQNNLADSEGGGGFYNFGTHPTLINVTFLANSAPFGNGGAIRNIQGGGVDLANSILWGNTALSGPQIFIGDTTTIRYSLVQGSGGSGPAWDTTIGTDGGGNLDADPSLDDEGQPTCGSVVIDAGENSAVPGYVTTDLAGRPRFFDVPAAPDTGSGTAPLVDMGAFEAPLAACLYLAAVQK